MRWCVPDLTTASRCDGDLGEVNRSALREEDHQSSPVTEIVTKLTEIEGKAQEGRYRRRVAKITLPLL
jgi:hypothetical protein